VLSEAQRRILENADPRKFSPTLLPPAKNKLQNLLNPKIIFWMMIFVGHQDVINN